MPGDSSTIANLPRGPSWSPAVVSQGGCEVTWETVKGGAPLVAS